MMEVGYDPEKHIIGQRFALSKAKHYSSWSYIKKILKENRSSELILFSDGTLEVNQNQNTLLAPESLRILNLDEVASVEYSSGQYLNRALYSTFSVISIGI